MWLFNVIVFNVNKMKTCGNAMSDSQMEQNAAKRIKLEISERPLNLAISPDELEIQSVKKAKLPRDPTAHRIIEKRRRDRMNKCLAELSQLIPPSYLKQGQGRIEKTEIIETASKIIRNLLNLHNFREMVEKELPSNQCCQENFYMGYTECQEDIRRHLIDTKGLDPKDAFFQRLTNLLEQSNKKFLTLSTMKSASDFQDVKPDNSLMSEATMSNFNSSRNGQVVQGMEISENNMAVIKQDKQLCTLLKPTKQTSSQTSGYCSSSNQSLSDRSSSCITLQSVQRDTAEKNDCYRSRGSSWSSDQNSSEDSNRHKIDYHKSHSYKFKHKYYKRFSQERRPYHLKSDKSSDSREDGNEQGKQNKMDCRTSSPGTQHSQYLGSQNSSTDSYCEQNNVLRYQNDFGSDGRFDSKQAPLPAFVLHPLGTHYVPVTIHPTHFKNVFKDETNTQASAAYHPISIPVNFCGPNVSIHPHVDQQLLFASERQKEETYSENS
ncbi:unnamed protein product [Mytilus edulis]|uniref:BHLH domain-containing protein n=1 Tax=Mytilus edulis TaxID=6550 RepID=A0A8S3SVA6_MYTED|nr:unnamed protein product [Mytilus edulis]